MRVALLDLSRRRIDCVSHCTLFAFAGAKYTTGLLWLLYEKRMEYDKRTRYGKSRIIS